jgi:hypothetical protein
MAVMSQVFDWSAATQAFRGIIVDRTGWPADRILWTHGGHPTGASPFVRLTSQGPSALVSCPERRGIATKQTWTVTIDTAAAVTFAIAIRDETHSVDGTALTETQIRDALLASIAGSSYATGVASGSDGIDLTAVVPGQMLNVIATPGGNTTTTLTRNAGVNLELTPSEIPVRVNVFARMRESMQHQYGATALLAAIVLGLKDANARDTLRDAGFPIVRWQPEVNLDAFAGQEYETRAQVELVCGAQFTHSHEVGAAESVNVVKV